MTARSLLVSGLLAGLLAGIATFFVAHQIGEPHVNTAIALEEASAAAPADHDHVGEAPAPHSHGSEEGGGTEVSRADQSTWGLATGTLAVGVALGGIVALVSAVTIGRLGRLTAVQGTAVVTLVGFVAFALVPFLKYPSTPPAVGSGDTIGARTGWYFLFVLISVVVAVAATVLAARLWREHGAYVGTVAGVLTYTGVMVGVGLLMPTVNEVGDFPADTLWFFRRASLLILATLWAVIGLVLTGLVSRLQQQAAVTQARRELAASL